MDWISNMFVMSLPVVEKILRPILVYLFLVIGLRLAGKRELAQLNPFDLVVLLTLSNTVQNAIIGNDTSLSGGIIGATTLLIINSVVVRLVHNNPRLSGLVEGKTDYLIHQGRINKPVLRREDITVDELLTAARKEGFQSLNEIQEATIDGNGVISFFGKISVVAETHQRELLERLDQLSVEVENLSKELARLNRGKGE
jgi:uncharacterized membrane protein YcaP (DUF421 family)